MRKLYIFFLFILLIILIEFVIYFFSLSITEKDLKKIIFFTVIIGAITLFYIILHDFLKSLYLKLISFFKDKKWQHKLLKLTNYLSRLKRLRSQKSQFFQRNNNMRDEKPINQEMTNIVIACDKCKIGTMEKKEIYRFSGCLIFLGYLLLITTILIILPIFYFSISSTDKYPIAAGFGFMFIVILFYAAIPILIVGLLLVLKRKVWKCNNCGYIFDRA